MTKAYDLETVQKARKMAIGIMVLGGAVLMLLFAPAWEHTVHRHIEAVGLLFLAMCIVGRSVSSLYISGYKNAHLIDTGPYSICRNPLYTFSIIGAAGIGALSGSVIVSLITAAATWLVFRIVVTREEQFLLSEHGQKYERYLSRVPRFVPDLSLWTTDEKIAINASGLVRTFADASVFLLAIPLFEVLEMLREGGSIPIVLRLP
ncbi:MAG: isoprenylcysteine carboxylmethyltransferase family protein [Xanthobacteraceae bacterium]|jgi:protein-S-isoprenylcysteine O-methyltransferase Ste14